MLRALTLSLALLPTTFAVPLVQAQDAGPAGSWKGAIELPGTELVIRVELEQREEWSATISIPAQGLRNFALSDVGVELPDVGFAMQGIPGDPVFEGEYDEEADRISGSFTQGGREFSFFLERSKEKPAEEEEIRPIPGEGAAGEWMGSLQAGPFQLRLAVHIRAGQDGVLEATMDSLDQNAKGIGIDQISFEARVLHFTIERIQAAYEGELNEDGSSLVGTWTQAGNEMPLTLHRLEQAYDLRRPQQPKPPFPYESTDVTFENEAAGITLAGSYIRPEGAGPFPSVLFVTGSGAQDRDESLMGHKPFLVIADHLARKGIASLRYDDRGVGESGGKHQESNVLDFAEDAAAGLAFLAGLPDSDPQATGLIGHSEGGLVGPMLAGRSKHLDFLVLLAAPGERLDLVVIRQSRDMLTLGGAEASMIDRLLEGREQDFALIKDVSLSTEELRNKLEALARKRIEQFTDEELEGLGVDKDDLSQEMALYTSPWFRSLMRQDPAQHLKNVRVPVLALFGEKDVQVDAAVNSLIVETVLIEEAQNTDATVRTLPGLNHLFQTAETGAIAEYGVIEETFAPSALETIERWIVKRYGSR